MKRRLVMTPELAREIRREVASTDHSAREIALRLGIPERTVQNVVSGHTFIEAGGPLRKIHAPDRLELSDEQVRKIRVLRLSKTSKGIAAMFGCSEAAVRHIWTGRMHAERGHQPLGLRS